MKFRLSVLILVLVFAMLTATGNVGAQGKVEKDKIRIGYAARARR